MVHHRKEDAKLIERRSANIHCSDSSNIWIMFIRLFAMAAKSYLAFITNTGLPTTVAAEGDY
jgi:hypothetical protein